MADSRVEALIQEYLAAAQLMQLATVQGEKPWICTVYYVFHEGSLYWLSWPERRHSQELAKNPYVAAAIAVKHDLPVIGLQIEGTAEEVGDASEVEVVMELYVAKYNAGKKFYSAFVAGTNHHRMYRLTPHEIVLFDELNFPENDTKVVEQL